TEQSIAVGGAVRIRRLARRARATGIVDLVAVECRVAVRRTLDVEHAIRHLLIKRSIRVRPASGSSGWRGTKQHIVIIRCDECWRGRVFVAKEDGRHLEGTAHDGRGRFGAGLSQRRGPPRHRGGWVQLAESSRGAQPGARGADGPSPNPPDTIFPKIKSGNLPPRVSPILRSLGLGKQSAQQGADAQVSDEM